MNLLLHSFSSRLLYCPSLCSSQYCQPRTEYPVLPSQSCSNIIMYSMNAHVHFINKKYNGGTREICYCYSEDAIDKLLSDKDSNNTKKSTKVSVGILEGYLSAKGKLHLITTQSGLAIYVEARKNTEKYSYSMSTPTVHVIIEILSTSPLSHDLLT